MESSKTCTDVIKEKTKELKNSNEKISNNLKKCFIEATKEIDGYRAFKYIKKICLWDEKYSQTSAEQELYKKARRDVWLLIREFIPDNVLTKLEILDKTDIFEELNR